MRNKSYFSAAILFGVTLGTASAADDKDALIKDALSAAPPEIVRPPW
jgi:hypothetical protein